MAEYINEELEQGWGGSGETATTSTKIAPKEQEVINEPEQKLSGRKKGKPSQGVKADGSRAGVIRYPREYLNQRLKGLSRDKRVLTKAEQTQYFVEKYAAEGNLTADGYAVGFDFSMAQQRAVDAIFKLNRDLSTNREDREAEDYYKGNGERAIYQPKEVEEALPERMAVINSDWATYAKRYWDKDLVTGTEIRKAKEVLISIARTNYPIFLPLKDGSTIVTYIPLCWLAHKERESNFKLRLNPLLTRGIEDSYISAPDNSMQRIAVVHGSNKLPSGYKDFFDYLLRDIANKQHKRTYTLRTLCNMIAREWIENRHTSTAISRVYQALEEFKMLGIIRKYSPDSATDLEDKIEVVLNPAWQ